MFTFKTEKATGRYRAFFPDSHIIKINKKKVGNITDSRPHKIRFMVIKSDINEDGNPNCSFKWITLKKECETVKEAKEWLKTVYNDLIEKYNFHFSD